MEGQTPTTPIVESTPPTEGEVSTNLPSDDVSHDFSGFEITDDIKGRFKDGKLNGRFQSLSEVLEKLKETEDRYANLVRDNKNSESTQLLQTQQQEVINKYIPEFLSNGMQVTPEMEKAILETGIDIRDLKLGAIEVREKVQAAHSVVGSSEEYNAMLSWGKENMTEAQKKAFDSDVTNPTVSEYAIKGLYADYKNATSQQTQGQQPPQRIEGQPSSNSLRAYSNLKELLADKRYLSTAKGKNDIAAQQKYNARLKVTPESVWNGR